MGRNCDTYTSRNCNAGFRLIPTSICTTKARPRCSRRTSLPLRGSESLLTRGGSLPETNLSGWRHLTGRTGLPLRIHTSRGNGARASGPACVTHWLSSASGMYILISATHGGSCSCCSSYGTRAVESRPSPRCHCRIALLGGWSLFSRRVSASYLIANCVTNGTSRALVRRNVCRRRKGRTDPRRPSPVRFGRVACNGALPA